MAKPETKKEMWGYTLTKPNARKKAKRAVSKARRKAVGGKRRDRYAAQDEEERNALRNHDLCIRANTCADAAESGASACMYCEFAELMYGENPQSLREAEMESYMDSI